MNSILTNQTNTIEQVRLIQEKQKQPNESLSREFRFFEKFSN